jgi:hypothetical protein
VSATSSPASRGPTYVATVGTSALSDSRVLTGFAAVPTTQMTYGTYDGSLLSRVILYTPGTVTATSAQVTEPSPGIFSWGGLSTLTFPQQVQLIVTVLSPSGARLAVLYSNGAAATFDYDGTTLTHRSDLPGSDYEMIVAIGTNGLLSRTTSGGWQRWDVSSAVGTLTETLSGVFPAASAAAKFSNVIFVTGGEPFANPDATPVFLGHVRDWTTAATGMGSSWSVTALVQGPGGLESPTSVDYEPVDADGDGLPDQWEEAFAAYDPNGDEDNDGSINSSEYQNGTDPRDPTSFGQPSEIVLNWEVVNTLGGQTLRLSWPTSDTTAVLQTSETLQPDSWIDVTTGIVIEGSEFVHSLPLGPANPPKRFFRLLRP